MTRIIVFEATGGTGKQVVEQALKGSTSGYGCCKKPNWTVIRPPWLRNTKHKGKYRTAINEYLSNPSKISRADLADYIVNHLDDEKTFKAKVELSY